MAYEPVNPTLIENTTMQKYISRTGVFLSYQITPNEGYVLHDNAGNFHLPDENNPEAEVEQEAYFYGSCSCGASYEFTPVTMTVPDRNGNTITVTAYGSREFFAIPESTAPENNIFGDTDNNHEVM